MSNDLDRVLAGVADQIGELPRNHRRIGNRVITNVFGAHERPRGPERKPLDDGELGRAAALDAMPQDEECGCAQCGAAEPWPR